MPNETNNPGGPQRNADDPTQANVAPWDAPPIPVIKTWKDVAKIVAAIVLFYSASGAHNVFASAVNFASFHVAGSTLTLPGLSIELFNGAKFSVLDGILRSVQGAVLAWLGPYYGPIVNNTVRVVGQFSQAVRAQANPNWRGQNNNNNNNRQ